MKRFLLLLLMISLLFCPLFALRNNSDKETHEFDSDVMLESFFNEEERRRPQYDNVSVSILTVSKGKPLYSWFGHSAILIEDETSFPIMYDYGRFAFGGDFYKNFAMGRLWYNCSKVPAVGEIENFDSESRSVSKVVLDLTPQQKKAIVDFLNINSATPYNVYMYHHYKDNCATRIRDIINEVTDGDFKKWAESQEGYSFRDATSMILRNNVACNWLLDFLQSGNIDRKNTRWEQMFLPSELEKGIIDYNRHLVESQEYVCDHRNDNVYANNFESPQSYFVISAIIGLLAAFSVILVRNRKALLSVLSCTLNLVLGLMGTLLFFMMFFTSHDVTWNNENILFINPLLTVAALLSIRHSKHKKALSVLFLILAFAAIALCYAKVFFPAVFLQKNYSQIIAVLPYYIAMWAIMRRKSE